MRGSVIHSTVERHAGRQAYQVAGQYHDSDDRSHLDQGQGQKAYLAGDLVALSTLAPVGPGEYRCRSRKTDQGAG